VVTHDDELCRELVAALRRAWTVVDQARDGLAALYALDVRTPDAVVLDMDVPEVTGHRVYRVLRDDPETRRVPVVMVASETCQEVCARPSAVAAPEWFFQKPVTPELVLGALAQAEVLPSYARNQLVILTAVQEAPLEQDEEAPAPREVIGSLSSAAA